MRTTPFGAPASAPPLTAPAAFQAAAPGRRTPGHRPLVLACAGLGALVLVAGAVLGARSPDPLPVSVPVPVAGPAPSATTTPTSTVSPAVALPGPDGHNPFLSLVAPPDAPGTRGVAGPAVAGAGGSAVTGSAVTGSAVTGSAVTGSAVTGSATGTGAPGVRARSAPVPTVTLQVPGPTVTQQVPVPVAAPATGPLLLTYLGPDPDAPGASRFLVGSTGATEPRSVAPGQAFDGSGPLSWLVYTGPGDDGRAVVTGGMRTYVLTQGTAASLA